MIGQAEAKEGGAILRLGAPAERLRPDPRDASLLGRNTVLVVEDGGRFKVCRAPWSDAVGGRLSSRSILRGMQTVEPASHSFDVMLDPAEAAERIVTDAVVPLCDESLLDGVLLNAQWIADAVSLREVGHRSLGAAALVLPPSTPPRGSFAAPIAG